jgi:Ca-activated chloride channel homolog
MPLIMSDIDTRLLADLPTDLRIVLDWDSHDVDIDLWVTDPRGEKCYYANRRTAIGGRMSPDFTQGYGPEEYLIRNARPGVYKVEVTYYSTRRQDIFVPVNVQLQFFTNYGRRNQTLRETSLRLGKENEVLLAGEIDIP